jgi:hypothetical protein
MTEDEKIAANSLVESINHNTQWTGRTTRELRDKVEMASKQIESLVSTLNSVSKTNSNDLEQLTSAINKYSVSSDKLSKRMVWLTAILAIATVLSAIATCVAVFKH